MMFRKKSKAQKVNHISTGIGTVALCGYVTSNASDSDFPVCYECVIRYMKMFNRPMYQSNTYNYEVYNNGTELSTKP